MDGVPEGPEQLQEAESPKTPNGQPTIPGRTIDELFEWCVKNERDLDQHMETLRSLALQCDHVTEGGKRRESAIAFAAGNPQTLISYLAEDNEDPSRESLAGMAADTDVRCLPIDDFVNKSIEPTDLLFVDWQHNAKSFGKQMELHAKNVRRWIVMHDTKYHARQGDDGGKGLLAGMKTFVGDGKKWFVMSHTDDQFGLTVLSCNEEDRPDEPIEPWATWYGIGEGPGTELGKLLNEIDIEPPEGCTCKGKAHKMNLLGVEGCREKIDELSQMMREGAEQWKWTEKIGAGMKLWMKHPRFAMKLTANMADPWPAIIEECCARAESKMGAVAS